MVVRLRIGALSQLLSNPEFSFINELIRVLMPLALDGLTDLQLTTCVFNLLLLQLRSVVFHDRWTVANVLLSSRLLVACRKLILQLHIPAFGFDEKVRDLMGYWSHSFIPRLFPRPSMPICLMSLSDANTVMCEWQGVTSIVSGAIPKSDHICKVNWLRMSGVFSSSLHVEFIVGMSYILDAFYLERDAIAAMQRTMTLSWKVNLKAILRSYCARVTLPAAAPCSLFRARDELHMRNFVEFLQKEPSYCCTYVGEQVVEFTSKSLLRVPGRYSRFLHFSCDRQDEFSTDFVITCYIRPEGRGIQRSLGLERAYKLDNPVNHVVLSSRNSLSSKRLATELQVSHGLALLDGSVSPQERLNASDVNTQDAAFTVETFSHIWTFIQLDREGIWDYSPRVAFEFANFYIDSAMQRLLTPKRYLAHTNRFIWRGVFLLLKWCVNHMCKFYRQGRIYIMGLKCLPLLSYIQQAVMACPFSEAFNPHELDRALAELQWCLRDASKSPEHHFEHNLRCAILCTKGCRESLAIAPPNITRANRPTSGVVISEIIGTGTFGIVYKVYDYELNHVVALKEIDLRSGCVPDKAAMEEVNNLRCLHHQNVVKFYNASVIDGKLYINTEYCAGGSLQQAIPRLILRKADEANMIFRKTAVQLLLGLCFLHGNNVIHGDLKPANILMDIFGRIKLADFGATCSFLQATSTTGRHNPCFVMGTAEFMAPETILHGQITAKSDVWSLGCTLYHMVTGRTPWEGYTKPWGILKSLTDARVFELNALEEAVVDEDAKGLIRSCLRLDPANRPPSLELLMCPFLYDKVDCLWTNVEPQWS